MISDLLGFPAVADVFPQVRKDGSDFFTSQGLRGNQCVIQRFSRHEARHALSHKLVMRSMVAQPVVLGSSQLKGTHQAHKVFSPQKWYYASACSSALAP